MLATNRRCGLPIQCSLQTLGRGGRALLPAPPGPRQRGPRSPPSLASRHVSLPPPPRPSSCIMSFEFVYLIRPLGSPGAAIAANLFGMFFFVFFVLLVFPQTGCFFSSRNQGYYLFFLACTCLLKIASLLNASLHKNENKSPASHLLRVCPENIFLTAEKGFRLTRSVNVAASTPSADQMGPFYLYIQALKASAEMFSLLEGEGRRRVGMRGERRFHIPLVQFFLQTVTIN